MPAWGEILKEFGEIKSKGNPAFADDIRHKYLDLLHKHTGRTIVLYAAKWTQPVGAHPDLISVVDEDMQGFMEVVRGFDKTNLDLILHSPGGSPVAAEAIVFYLRSRFPNIRVIVPQAAMSAATMIACSSDKIIMGLHSSLGPIDPQMVMQTSLGYRMVPAQAILDQFEKAQNDCKNPEKIGSWMPILGQYGPSLLVECENALNLSKHLVRKWLGDYMFCGVKNGKKKAAIIARKLADHRKHMSHGRHLSFEAATKMGLSVESLEADKRYQDLVLSVFHATMLTFTMTPAVKIIENHDRKAFIKISGTPVSAPPKHEHAIVPLAK